MASIAGIDTHLKGELAPHGIVSFEFCAFSQSCEALLKGWSGMQREYAMLSLGLDYLYLVLYSVVIACALLVVASRLAGTVQSISRSLAALMAAAALADAAENYCLIRLLAGGELTMFSLPAALFASFKFVVIAAALVWLVVAFALSLRSQSDA